VGGVHPVGGVLPVDGVSSGGPWSVIVASTHHPPHEQVLVRLEGRGSSGPWCRGPEGRDVSDVARIAGSGGTYRAGIPLHGSPGVPLTLLVPVHGLTSRFDGKEGGLRGHPQVWVVLRWTDNLDPRLTRNTISEEQ
jgi:hypothetical protein